MKSALVALVAAAALGVAVASSSSSAAPASLSAVSNPSFFAPPRVISMYGHVRSLARKGGRFELRFDPALWLGGVTANRAAIEDKVIPPGDTVPNDYYIREEGHRLLTYRVPASAHVTVLTFNATHGIRSTAIAVSELAQVLKGKNPKHRRFYGLRLGFWIRVATDTVRSLDQQYQP